MRRGTPARILAALRQRPATRLDLALAESPADVAAGARAYARVGMALYRLQLAGLVEYDAASATWRTTDAGRRTT